MMLWNANQEEVDEDLFSLACGPDLRVKKYSPWILMVWGLTQLTVCDKNKKTQNSAVVSQSIHNGQPTDFVGVLKEIIKLEYN